MKQKNSIFIFFFFICFVLLAQQNEDDLYLYDRFQPLGKENIFKTTSYYNWGGSIIKDKKGKYGRWLASVIHEGTNINDWLVKQGHAVVAHY